MHKKTVLVVSAFVMSASVLAIALYAVFFGFHGTRPYALAYVVLVPETESGAVLLPSVRDGGAYLMHTSALDPFLSEDLRASGIHDAQRISAALSYTVSQGGIFAIASHHASPAAPEIATSGAYALKKMLASYYAPETRGIGMRVIAGVENAQMPTPWISILLSIAGGASIAAAIFGALLSIRRPHQHIATFTHASHAKINLASHAATQATGQKQEDHSYMHDVYGQRDAEGDFSEDADIAEEEEKQDTATDDDTATGKPTTSSYGIGAPPQNLPVATTAEDIPFLQKKSETTQDADKESDAPTVHLEPTPQDIKQRLNELLRGKLKI